MNYELRMTTIPNLFFVSVSQQIKVNTACQQSSHQINMHLPDFHEGKRARYKGLVAE